MEKWIYKVISIERLSLAEKYDIQGQGTKEGIEIALNAEGDNGWELVCVIGDASALIAPILAFFKKKR